MSEVSCDTRYVIARSAYSQPDDYSAPSQLITFFLSALAVLPLQLLDGVALECVDNGYI